MSPPVDEESGIIARNHQASQETPSTVLPSHIAGAVSLATRSSSLYLRLGTFVGGLALDGARVTTLTGLELSRAVIEGILTRAGNDVTTRAKGELGKSDAEGLLERSMSTLHSTITSISFAVSTGFHFSSATLSTASDISQHLLSTLDSILGSTDSSRAIASIITLIRREFQNPATGQQGEKVGVIDLLFGICGLALLQKWSRKMILLETKEKNHEQTVWDVVMLDDGRRADVLSDDYQKVGNTSSRQTDRPVSFMTTTGDEKILRTMQREDANEQNDIEEWPEAGLREHIMEGLPQDATLSITTSTTTTKMITIEVVGATPIDISPPPGVELIEENSQPLHQADFEGCSEHDADFPIPRYRVVYRAIQNTIKAGHESILETSTYENPSTPIATTDEVSKIPHQSISELSLVPESPALDGQTTDDGDLAVPLSDLNQRELPNLDDLDSAVKSKPEIITSSGKSQSTSTDRASPTHENSANQKRPRIPVSSASSSSADKLGGKSSIGRASLAKRNKIESNVKKSEDSQIKKTERKVTLRNVLKKGSGTTLSNLWNKDLPKLPDDQISVDTKSSQQRPPRGGSSIPVTRSTKSALISGVRHPPTPLREAPRAPQRGNPNYFSSRDLGITTNSTRSPSRASFYSIHERRRDSIVSQTDTYSIHSGDRPSSPTTIRTKSRSQRMEQNTPTCVPISPKKVERRNLSHRPSIYTINANNSATSLMLTSPSGPSTLQDPMAISTLARIGFVDGMFPRDHLVRNMTRFIRFASASYGSHFLRIMGIASSEAMGEQDPNASHHQEHHSFSSHTKLPTDTILISSFVDPQGGTDSTGQTNTGVPMVHFVSLDHESRAVVLTCRGTLGFEDVLTDMTCDYDELVWRGKAYNVHKGIHASARRLLEDSGGRVMATIKVALEEFPDYGLVLTGHSLGGAVTALLAIMISEPQEGSTAFLTSSTYQKPQLQLTSAEVSEEEAPPDPIFLPPGRPIHVFAYGPPSSISPSLALATRGLITTIVNGQDLVPYLSLGTLHDLQAVALAFKSSDSGAKAELRGRLWSGLSSGFTDRWSGKVRSEEEDYATLKTLRATMLSPKLVPPGEVFLVETERVLQKHAFAAASESSTSEGLGRPATRVTLRYVRDVEARFGELRFGGSMLLDHSPGRYETSLSSLGKGVLE